MDLRKAKIIGDGLWGWKWNITHNTVSLCIFTVFQSIVHVFFKLIWTSGVNLIT